MTCPRCIPMCATTEAKHANRQRNMAAGPSASPHPCPGCGSMEWATTREMIKPELSKERWWRRTPSWQTIMYAAWGLFGFAMGNGLFAVGYYQVASAFCAGFALHMALSSYRMISITENLRRIRGAFDEVHQLNHALIENRVQMHIASMSDDEPPLAPRLH